eukprot:2406065-Rhodomonas_salina.9
MPRTPQSTTRNHKRSTMCTRNPFDLATHPAGIHSMNGTKKAYRACAGGMGCAAICGTELSRPTIAICGTEISYPAVMMRGISVARLHREIEGKPLRLLLKRSASLGVGTAAQYTHKCAFPARY